MRVTGWGIIDVEGDKFSHVANGSIRTNGKDLAKRLKMLHEELQIVIENYGPNSAAIEKTFINKDASGALKLGHARAIALLVPAQAGIPVAEYAPNKIKNTVAGVGHANKDQISYMVGLELSNPSFDSTDASDALATAITHALLNTRMARLHIELA